MKLGRLKASGNNSLTSKSGIVDYIFTCISCWLVSMGTCLLLDSQFEYEVGFVTILWQTLLAIIVSALLTIKWWLPIIYISVLVPVLIGALAISGKLGYFWQSTSSVIKWWIDFMPSNSEWYTEQGFFLIHTMINIGVSFLYFVVARISKRAWPVVLVCLGIITGVLFTGYTEYNILAVPFLVVGLFPMLAGDGFNTISPFIKNNTARFTSRIGAVLISAIICVVIAAGSLLIMFADNIDVRTRKCSDIVADIQTATNVYTVDQQKLRVTLFDLGLQSNSTYIGGSLYNIAPKVIAVTNLHRNSLLKVTTFDTYNGKRWYNNFEKAYRINGPWDAKQKIFLSGTALDNKDYSDRLNSVAATSEITISLEEDCDFLPTYGQITGFKENLRTRNPVLFDKRGQVFSFFGLPKGYTYTLNSVVYATAIDFTMQHYDIILSGMNSKTDPLYQDKEFIKHYTTLPEKIPSELIDTLQRLDIDPNNPYRSAYLISEFFSVENGFSYTTTPPRFVKGEDIVKKLFETKKGHCVYYATAMVVMARAAGIPCRLAAGYLTVESKKYGGAQVIDASSPYCWVECYFPNIGWVSYDPTPVTNPNTIEIEEELTKDVPNPPDQITTPDRDRDDEEQNDEQNDKNTLKPWQKVLLTILSVLLPLVIIAGYLALRILFAPKFYKLGSVRKRFSSTVAQAEYYYQDFLRQFAALGYRPRRHETMRELIERLKKSLIRQHNDALVEVIKIIEAVHYGNSIPTDQEIEQLSNLWRTLDLAANWNMQNLEFILKRRVFLPIFSLKAYKIERQYRLKNKT
ncbi:MAG: transglutaminase domain-containing protein [Acutalibacteraceae bacterium]|jgi:hypothetical protein